MSRRQYGQFDEVNIGASLVLSFGDQIVQTSATVDAHRIARSTFAQDTFVSYIEFYLYSPDGSKPSLATVAGVPPVSLGIVTSAAALNKYCGEDTHGYGLAPDGKVYNNGSGTSLGVTFTYGDYIGALVDPVNGTIQFYKNGAAISTPVSFTAGAWYYAVTVSGDAGKIGVWANAGQTPQRFSQGIYWWQPLTSIAPIFLATEPYITASGDDLPSQRYHGDIDRLQSPPSFHSGVKFWPWGTSCPVQRGGQTQIHLLDPDNIYDDSLLASDVRDLPIALARLARGSAATTAENVATVYADHVAADSDQTKIVYCTDILAKLQSQMIRPLFPPDVDPSVALRPRPDAWGICRTFVPPLYDATNRDYAIGDSAISAFGKVRVQGKQIAYGTDFTLTADGAGIQLAADPAGKLTAETSTFGSAFDPLGTDFLGGLGDFSTESSLPADWTLGHSSFASSASDWSLQTTAPRGLKCLNENSASKVAWAKEATHEVQPGRTYAYSVTVVQVPFASPHPAQPATIGISISQAGPNGIGPPNDYMAWLVWQQQLPDSISGPVTYTGNFTVPAYISGNSPVSLIFTASNLSSPLSAVVVSKFEMQELPAVTDNVVLDGPGLNESLQNFLITRGPLQAQDYDSTNAIAIDTATGYKYGLYTGTNDTPIVEDRVKRICDSACADVYGDANGNVNVVRLIAPEDVSTGDLAGYLTVTDVNGYLTPYPDNAENLTPRAYCTRNVDPYSDSDFTNMTTTDVPLTVRAELKQNFQQTAVAGIQLSPKYLFAYNADPLETCFDLLIDAQAEITRVNKLYTSQRYFYKGQFFAPLGRQFQIGQVWGVTYPIGNLRAGQQLLLVEIDYQPSEELATLTLWGL